MKARTVGLVVAVALAVLLLAGVSASAGAEKSQFEGWAQPIGLLDFGTCEYNGEMEICRGLTVVWILSTNDPRFSGELITVINSNFQVADTGNYGPQWGTWQAMNEDGLWEGHWTGVKNPDGSTYLKGEGQGQGLYDGLKVKFTGVRLSPSMFDPLNVEGEILDPPAG